jgi:hypothetical protein
VQTDAALVIARWCWPNEPWNLSANMRLATGAITGRPFYPDRMDDVHAAELVVIERGLAEEYGRALAFDLWPTEPKPKFTFSIALALAATAPLDARVRALVAAIEAQP